MGDCIKSEAKENYEYFCSQFFLILRGQTKRARGNEPVYKSLNPHVILWGIRQITSMQSGEVHPSTVFEKSLPPYYQKSCVGHLEMVTTVTAGAENIFEVVFYNI